MENVYQGTLLKKIYVPTALQEETALVQSDIAEVYKRANEQLAALFSNGERARNFGFAVFVFLMLSACGSTDLSEPAPQIPDDTPPVVEHSDVDAMKGIVSGLDGDFQFALELFVILHGDDLSIQGCTVGTVSEYSSIDACIADIRGTADDSLSTQKETLETNYSVRTFLNRRQDGRRAIKYFAVDDTVYLVFEQPGTGEYTGKVMVVDVTGLSPEDLKNIVYDANNSALLPR